MKKIQVLILIAMLLLVHSAISIASSHTWQHSSSPLLKIGLRDKYGNLSNTNYTANFVIYAPNNRTYYYSTKGTSDKWASSIVPDDYKGMALNPGDYSWQCYVDNEMVASGAFRIMQEGIKKSISEL
ncbi:hypothetical protein [Sporomusa aerivorans]|uniref:hypothetical protein n=1 Tax=Sporomusa aerivorans TaxID=204936 RepID=UPI00352B3BA7